MTSLEELLDDLMGRALRCEEPSRSSALELLGRDDEDLLDIVAAAGRVRRRFFQNRVKLNFLVNMKSGLCPEDCSYCSQRRGSQAGILRYGWIGSEEAAAAADAAVAGGAARICLVASGRGPSERDLERVAEAVGEIRRRHPGVEVCTSLGLLAPGQASRLRAAGVFAYNHNLNTSASRYGEICTTHGFDDRRDTLSGAAPLAVLGGDLRHGRGGRRHRRPGDRAASPAAGLGSGQLPHAIRGDADGRPLRAHPATLPQDPLLLPLLLPQRRAAHRRRQGAAPS
jgi:hypothetical protein